MKVGIIGGSGFIGRHLLRYFQANGDTVRSFSSKECDLCCDGSLDKLDHDVYDIIYHLAAWTRAGSFCDHYCGDQWVINQKMNTHVLSWWQKYQPQAKLIAFGTSVSYTGESDHCEEDYFEGVPHTKYYAYAMTKRMLYAGLLALSKQYGLKYLYVIPSTVYGPDYHLDGRELHFIYDLIRKILIGHKTHQTVSLWGDGYQRRELVYIDDFIDWVLHLSNMASNEIINLGAGEDYSIRDFASLICKRTGYDFKKIEFDREAFVGAKSKVLKDDRLNAWLPNRKKTRLELGLNKTIDWVESNLDKGLLYSEALKDN